MFSMRPLSCAIFRLSCSPVCRASTSSARHFSFLGRNLSRFQSKEPFRQLQNALNKHKEAKEAPRADSIPPRPFGQVIIRGGIFFLVTSSIFSTLAAVYDYETSQKRFQSVIDQAMYEFRRILALTPMRDRHAESVKLIWTIIGANMAVFLLWRVPSLQPMMWRYFSNSVASKSLCLPMLLSVFSHQHFMHLFLNMYVLNSFAIGAIGLLGPAQFLSLYLCGGVFSSLLSLCSKAAVGAVIPSVGASGAICAVIGYICTKLPDTAVHIIFLPMFKFSAESALYGLLAFELVCASRVFPIHRFMPLDNFAHIGGLLFGMYYANYGEIHQSKYVMRTWSWTSNDGSSTSTSKILVSGRDIEPRKQQQLPTKLTTHEEKDRRKELRRRLAEEEQTQRKHQKNIEKRQKEWVQQIDDEREAVKERIRLNREREERRKSAKGRNVKDDDDED